MDLDSIIKDKSNDHETRPYILIVDDERAARERIKILLEESKEHDVVTIEAPTIEQGKKILSQYSVAVMVLDKNLGESADGESINGIKSIPEFKQISPTVQIIVATGEGDTRDVVEAMNFGACDFLHKNDDDALIRRQIEKALSDYKRNIRAIRFRRAVGPKQKISFGNSMASKRLLNGLAVISRSNLAVLLLGEPGTGKTTAAHILHDLKARELGVDPDDLPFCKINVATLPDAAEGELFGTEKGTFTGVENKQGLVELANGGTLFLDEIGELPEPVQAKLLEVLQEGTFRRVGGRQTLHSKFRLIAATNRNLEEMVKEGKFRKDLYERISLLQLEVPSLKDRSEDIPDIIRDILPDVCRDNNVVVSFEELPQDFIAHLQENPPIGNFRGLQKKLGWLLTFAPRDKSGQPVFNNWKKIPGLIDKAGSGTNRRELEHGVLTLKDLYELEFDIVGDPAFPGIKSIIHMVEAKLILDARRKASTDKDAGKLLGIVGSSVARKWQTVSASLSKTKASSQRRTSQRRENQEVLQ